MATTKLSQIASGGAVAGATDTCVAVRSGTTDVLVTPVALDTAQAWTGIQTFGSGKILCTGGLPVAQGGTGATTATGALTSLLPSQTGNSGQFLTTNATTTAWALPLPAQGSNSGLFLTTNGTSASWASSLPTQTSNSGKFLTTNGTSASWALPGSLATTATFPAGTAIVETVNGVLTLTSTATGSEGWIQNTAGEGALNANFTNATATMAATNIVFNLIAGRSYRIEGFLILSNSASAEGVQIDFNGGTATATLYDVTAQLVSGAAGVGVSVATGLSTALTFTGVTGNNYVSLLGYIQCNAAGTLILRGAEITHVTGTATIAAGSWVALADTVRV